MANKRQKSAYLKIKAKTKPFQKGGKRFKAIAKAAKKGGALSGEAVAAFIGRKKYGASEFAQRAANAKRRKK